MCLHVSFLSAKALCELTSSPSPQAISLHVGGQGNIHGRADVYQWAAERQNSALLGREVPHAEIAHVRWCSGDTWIVPIRHARPRRWMREVRRGAGNFPPLPHSIVFQWLLILYWFQRPCMSSLHHTADAVQRKMVVLGEWHLGIVSKHCFALDSLLPRKRNRAQAPRQFARQGARTLQLWAFHLMKHPEGPRKARSARQPPH